MVLSASWEGQQKRQHQRRQRNNLKLQRGGMVLSLCLLVVSASAFISPTQLSMAVQQTRSTIMSSTSFLASMQTTNASSSMDSSSDHEKLQFLLDQAVMLYSAPSISLYVPTDSSADTEQAICELRKREITDLIEKLSEKMQDVLAIDSPSKETIPNAFLEVQRLIDDAIVEAMTQDKFLENVEAVTELAIARQRLAQDSDADISEATFFDQQPSKTQRSIEDLQTRFEQLQVLVWPNDLNTQIIGAPTIRGQDSSISDVLDSETESTKESSLINAYKKLEVANDEVATINGAEEEVEIVGDADRTLGKAEKLKVAEDASAATENVAKEEVETVSYANRTLNSALPIRDVADKETETTKEMPLVNPFEKLEVSEDEVTATDNMTEGGVETVDDAGSTLTSAAELLTVDEEEKDVMIAQGTTETALSDYNNTEEVEMAPVDAIAAVVTAAAVGAAIITKVPIMAAGVAISPMVSSAVSAIKASFSRKKPFFADAVITPTDATEAESPLDEKLANKSQKGAE